MFYSEHGAPHFHAAYGGYEIWMNLQNQWDLWHAARAATRAS